MFIDDFYAYKGRISQYTSKFPEMTEEATKNALIMPFFVLLGYDVFNPDEIIPEYTCDVAAKKGEKIDYAIIHDGEPIILIEAKKAGMKLQKQQQGQLYRYFSTNRARIAILTNGITYNFYSDINSPNIMDDEPFLSFNVLEDDENIFISSLEQFYKTNFNLKDILSKAVFLKYVNVVEQTLKEDLFNPSDELVKYFLSRPGIRTGGRITSQIIEKHRKATAEAMRKVMGVTVAGRVNVNETPQDTDNVQSVERLSNNDIIRNESVVKALRNIKELSDNLECKHVLENGISTIYISKSNITIGRLRMSVKRSSLRCDYTDLRSGKLYLFFKLEDGLRRVCE